MNSNGLKSRPAKTACRRQSGFRSIPLQVGSEAGKGRMRLKLCWPFIGPIALFTFNSVFTELVFFIFASGFGITLIRNKDLASLGWIILKSPVQVTVTDRKREQTARQPDPVQQSLCCPDVQQALWLGQNSPPCR